MPGKTLEIGHNAVGDIVVNFEPDVPASAFHAVFTPDEALNVAAKLLARVRQLRGEAHLTPCIACGEAKDGGYEVENGPGPFCSLCWGALEEHFTVISKRPEQ